MNVGKEVRQDNLLAEVVEEGVVHNAWVEPQVGRKEEVEVLVVVVVVVAHGTLVHSQLHPLRPLLRI